MSSTIAVSLVSEMCSIFPAPKLRESGSFWKGFSPLIFLILSCYLNKLNKNIFMQEFSSLTFLDDFRMTNLSCRFYNWVSVSRPMTPESALWHPTSQSVTGAFRYPDLVLLFRCRTGSGIGILFHSVTGRIRCRTVRHSGIIKNFTKM